MIQLPNGKISRTLAEQVGFNSAKIAEIIKWINDSDFIDKVIDLSDPSGTLTEAQYAIADLSPSYIVYGGKVFVKSLEDATNIDFFKVGENISEDSSLIASAERIRIVKASKAYSYAEVQLFESYSKSQLDSLFSQKASLSGATFTGNVSLSDSANLEAFENIVDKDGHKRFIEGELSLQTISGITFTYGRWSLSGTHLMIVIAGTVADGTVLSSGSWASLTPPQWILDKIYPVALNTIEVRDCKLFAADYTNQTIYCYFQKLTDRLQLYCGALTLTKERSFRFQFDLLIDNE